MTDFDAIARDLDLCDLGAALTTGKRRRRFLTHRKACFQAIKEANDAAGIPDMTNEELLAALEAPQEGQK